MHAAGLARGPRLLAEHCSCVISGSVLADILLMPTPCRWAVNIAGWLPKQEEWSLLLTLLPVEVQAEVQRYKLPADQRRALVSRLLQRKCAGDVCAGAVSEIVIQRTKGGKPFCANLCNRAAAPNFNYNVSHEVLEHLVFMSACVECS